MLKLFSHFSDIRNLVRTYLKNIDIVSEHLGSKVETDGPWQEGVLGVNDRVLNIAPNS